MSPGGVTYSTYIIILPCMFIDQSRLFCLRFILLWWVKYVYIIWQVKWGYPFRVKLYTGMIPAIFKENKFLHWLDFFFKTGKYSSYITNDQESSRRSPLSFTGHLCSNVSLKPTWRTRRLRKGVCLHSKWMYGRRFFPLQTSLNVEAFSFKWSVLCIKTG